VNNVFFDFDKYDLKSESYPELNRLAEILKKNPSARVEIGGHTDMIGTDEYNMTLSQKRAQAVVQYLVSAGCKKATLIAKGYGKTRPVAPGDSEEDHARNRRVEFRFVQ